MRWAIRLTPVLPLITSVITLIVRMVARFDIPCVAIWSLYVVCSVALLIGLCASQPNMGIAVWKKLVFGTVFVLGLMLLWLDIWVLIVCFKEVFGTKARMRFWVSIMIGLIVEWLSWACFSG